jgi:hypothetical protein
MGLRLLYQRLSLALLRAGRAVMTGKLAVTKETSLQVQIQFAPESKVPVEALGELC